ncbi:MAG: hypothetical protein JW798_09435 [Prolixibacteraceae bacterium]|nr:hypothetical protein [Prolixibacteraceae bacterium]
MRYVIIVLLGIFLVGCNSFAENDYHKQEAAKVVWTSVSGSYTFSLDESDFHDLYEKIEVDIPIPYEDTLNAHSAYGKMIHPSLDEVRLISWHYHAPLIQLKNTTGNQNVKDFGFLDVFQVQFEAMQNPYTDTNLYGNRQIFIQAGELDDMVNTFYDNSIHCIIEFTRNFDNAKAVPMTMTFELTFTVSLNLGYFYNANYFKI